MAKTIRYVFIRYLGRHPFRRVFFVAETIVLPYHVSIMKNEALARNTFYLTIASVAQKVISFVYFVWIARYAGLADTGDYFVALAVVMTAAVLADLGVTSVTIREIAKDPSKSVIWSRTAMGVKLFAVPLAVAVAIAVPFVLGYSQELRILIMIAVFVMIADSFSLTFYGILRGFRRLKYESLGIFFGQTITATIGGVFLALNVATIPLLIVALVVGSVWNVFFSAFHVWKRIGSTAFFPEWTLGWAPLKIAFPFFLAAAFVKVYSYIDSFILLSVLGSAAVGVYAVAYKLTYAFQFLPLAFVAALYPTMSAEAKDPQKLKETLMHSFWYLSLIGFPIVFGIFALAPEVILAFYGSEYADAILPLQVLIFALIFIFLDFPIGSLLNATDRQMLKTIIGGISMVVNVVANLILIPRYGIIGAPISAILGFIAMFSIDMFYAWRITKFTMHDFMKKVLPLLLASILMSGVVLTLKQHLYFVLTIPIGVIVYFVAAYLFKGIEKQHLAYFVKTYKLKGYAESPSSDN